MTSQSEIDRIKALATIDPEYKKAVESANNYPQYDYSDPQALIAKMRKDMEAFYSPNPPASGVTEKEVQCPARDGHHLRMLHFEPSQPSSSPRPLLVMYHGGGWTVGRPEDTAPYCRALASRFNAVVLSPSYRLGPEHLFPTAVHDGWDALQWLAAHASDLGATPTAGFIIGGISAGGNMASVYAHLARDTKLSPPLTGVFLQAPSLLAWQAVPPQYRDRYLSATQPECKSIITPPELQRIFRDSFRPDPYSALHSPFNWPTGHAGLPRHFLQVCGADLVRDDALLFEESVAEVGVQTRLKVYEGLPHIFWQVFRTLKATERFQRDFMEGLGWLLAGQQASM